MAAILTATDLRVRYNDRVILDQASLTIDEIDHIGMVGRNGAGKTTFLRLLTGGQNPDAGEITRRRDLLIGYMPQAFELDPSLTVAENVRAGASVVLGLIREFESLPPTSNRHDALEHRIQALDGWGLDHRIESAMSHLNCPAGGRDVRTLSGGEQRRVALCRAIVSRPDLLILDEPTNHLDTDSIEWLGEYLENYPGAFLLVTHDRYFLDRVTNRIVEVAVQRLQSYSGNYTDYLIERAERDATAEVVEHKRQMYLKRELAWVRRGPSARRTKSKDRMERYFEMAGEAPPEIDPDADLVIPPPPPLGNRTVEMINLGMELAGRRLFSGLSLNFAGGQRVGVTGRNGLGKTTLLKLLLGQMTPTDGSVRVGELTRFNYVDQGRLMLNEDRTVLEEVSDGTEFVLYGDHSISVRSYLRRFLFADDRINSLVKYLSGGERSRLLLARILKNGGNFLILDEPTNDLDLSTLRVLEEALLAFPGIVLVVSHDRYFLNRVCTDIMAFEGEGRVVHSVGNYDYYLEKKRKREAAASQPRPAAAGSMPAPPKAKGARLRKLTWKETQELAGMEQAILLAEQELARLEALFLQPGFHREHGHRTGDLVAEVAAGKARVAQLYRRWEELEALKAATAEGP